LEPWFRWPARRSSSEGGSPITASSPPTTRSATPSSAKPRVPRTRSPATAADPGATAATTTRPTDPIATAGLPEPLDRRQTDASTAPLTLPATSPYPRPCDGLAVVPPIRFNAATRRILMDPVPFWCLAGERFTIPGRQASRRSTTPPDPGGSTPDLRSRGCHDSRAGGILWPRMRSLLRGVP